MKLFTILLCFTVFHFSVLAQDPNILNSADKDTQMQNQMSEALKFYKMSLIELATRPTAEINKEISENLIWLQDKKINFTQKRDLIIRLKDLDSTFSAQKASKEEKLVGLCKAEESLLETINKLKIELVKDSINSINSIKDKESEKARNDKLASIKNHKNQLEEKDIERIKLENELHRDTTYLKNIFDNLTLEHQRERSLEIKNSVVLAKNSSDTTITINSSSSNTLINDNVTDFLTGMSRFITTRAKQELNESFFIQMYKQMEAKKDFQYFFPESFYFLKLTKEYQIPINMEQLKENFQSDIMQLPKVFFEAKDLQDTKLNFLQEWNNYLNSNSNGVWTKIALTTMLESKSIQPMEILQNFTYNLNLFEAFDTVQKKSLDELRQYDGFAKPHQGIEKMILDNDSLVVLGKELEKRFEKLRKDVQVELNKKMDKNINVRVTALTNEMKGVKKEITNNKLGISSNQSNFKMEIDTLFMTYLNKYQVKECDSKSLTKRLDSLQSVQKNELKLLLSNLNRQNKNDSKSLNQHNKLAVSNLSSDNKNRKKREDQDTDKKVVEIKSEDSTKLLEMISDYEMMIFLNKIKEDKRCKGNYFDSQILQTKSNIANLSLKNLSLEHLLNKAQIKSIETQLNKANDETNKNLISAIRFAEIVSSSMITNKKLVDIESFRNLLSNEKYFENYMNLLVKNAEAKYPNLSFNGKDIKDIFYTKKVLNQNSAELFKNYIKDLYVTFDYLAQLQKKELTKAQKQQLIENLEVLFDFLKNTINTTTKFINSTKSIDGTLNYNPEIIFNYVTPCIDFAMHMQTARYDLAISDMILIFGNVNDLNRRDYAEISSKRFINNLNRYGTLIANVSKAKDSNEMKEAIAASVLPVGSSRIKRYSSFSISLNAYAGAFYGKAFLNEIVDNNLKREMITTYGIFAPIGMSFNFGNLGSSRYKSSISLTGQLFDLGALVNFYSKKGDGATLPIDTKINFGDVIAPGGQISMSIGDLPISLMAGFQYVPNLSRISENQSEGSFIPATFRAHAGIVVDIPLFNLKVYEK